MPETDIMEITLSELDETLSFGADLAKSLMDGAVLAFTGDLGAGKTHLTKGVLQGLGEDPSTVTSPTFTLVHEYSGGRLPVFHFDFYRIDQQDELLAIGWEDYLDREGIIIVEWADKFPHLLPEGTQWWHLALQDDQTRILTRRPSHP